MTVKVRSQIVVLSVLLLIVAIMLVAGFFRVGETPILTAQSEDGRYTLIIEEPRNPELSLGPSACRIVLKRGFRTIVQHVIQVNNNGKAPGSDNFTVEWGSKDVAVTVTAEGQEQTIYRLAYDGSYP